MSKDVADGVNKLLAGVMTNGTGTRARDLRRPPAGRQDGHDRQQRGGLVRRLHPGDRRRRDDLDRQPQEAVHQEPGGQGGRRVPPAAASRATGFRPPNIYLEGSGSGDAGMKIWKPTMEKYLADVPRTSFKSPPSRIQNGKMVAVPSRFGLGIKAYTKKLEKAGFTVDTNYVYSDGVPRGGFVGWSPGSGSRVAAVQHHLQALLPGP